MTVVESFAPVWRADARVLVLGSMPGTASLAAGRYYAHPRNAFWPLMEALLGVPADAPYERRLRLLQDRGLALWDVAHRCRRHASADATIDEVVPNDLAGLLGRCPRIRALGFNGRKAEEMFTRLVAPDLGPRRDGLALAYLPSTSPAHAGLGFGSKLARWRELLAWL
ncbi:MAG: DNA-deoxyinosine glycosylase [Planctomycetota bacterium]